MPTLLLHESMRVLPLLRVIPVRPRSLRTATFIRFMSSKISITIKNDSGYPQTYVVFAEAPTVKPTPEDIRTNVMLALRGVAGDGGQAYFTLPSNPAIALCGTSNNSGKDDSVHFEVLDTMPVKLGAQTENGKLLPGTTCEVMVSEGVPRFSEEQVVAPLGEVGSFCVKTRRDFTYKEAAAGKFIVGIGVSGRLVDEIGPQALFVPRPNELYMVKPSRMLHVANARMDSRDVVTDELKEEACSVDFNQLQSSQALLVHTPDGLLVRQVASRL